MRSRRFRRRFAGLVPLLMLLAMGGCRRGEADSAETAAFRYLNALGSGHVDQAYQSLCSATRAAVSAVDIAHEAARYAAAETKDSRSDAWGKPRGVPSECSWSFVAATGTRTSKAAATPGHTRFRS